jgi:hypothetical protein
MQFLKENCVQFIQVTCTDKYTLKTQYMINLFKALNKDRYRMQKVIAIFFVPIGSKFTLLVFIDNLTENYITIFLTNGVEGITTLA